MKPELTMKASTIVRVLEMTMQDVRAQDIAERLGIKHVREIQNAHGYPNERTMLHQVQQLLALRDQPVTFDTDATPEPPRDLAMPGRTAVQRSGQPRPTAVTITTTTDSLQAFLENAKKHARGSISYEAERILARIEKLREAIAEVDADTKRLAEIRTLEQRLAELKAQKVAKSNPRLGAFPCDLCDRVATSGAGLSAHKRGAHGGAS